MWRKRILAGGCLWGLSIGCLLYSISLAAAPGDILWQIDMPGSQTPAIADDGTIYVSADRFYAVSQDGSIKRSRSVVPLASPTIAFDGSLYLRPNMGWFPPVPGAVAAVDSQGNDRWKFSYPPREYTVLDPRSLAIGSGGTIYVAFNEIYYGAVQALRWDGVALWTVNVYTQIEDIVVGREGSLFVSTILPSGRDHAIWSFRSDGTQRWQRQEPVRSISASAVGEDGTLYIGLDSDLNAIGDDGITRWTFPAGAIVTQTPTVSRDGTVFLAAGKKIYSLDDRGLKSWEFEADAPIATSPTLDSNGAIFFGSVSNRLYSLFPEGTLNWTVDLEPGGGISAPIFGNNGMIAIRAGNRLYAIDNGGVGPAQGGWPMVRRDSAQSASQFSAAIVPDVPEWFAATTNLYGINLTWTNVPGASTYEIWRGLSTNVEEATLVADVGARTDYFDASAGSGQTNYYWLRAKSGTVPGAFTEPVLGYSREIQPGDLLKAIAVGPCSGEMAISKDGSVFVGAGRLAPEFNGQGVYGINPDGTVRWVYGKFQFPNQISITDSGRVLTGYVGDIVDERGFYMSYDFPVTSLAASTGAREFTVGSEIGSGLVPQTESIAIGSDDTLYASLFFGALVALAPPGVAPIWHISTSYARVAPAIGPDGTIFQGGSSGVVAGNSDGTTRWAYASTNETFESWLAIDADGRVYARSGTGNLRTTLHCLGTGGRHLWQYSNGNILSSPAIDADGTAYVGGGALIALDRNGGLKWQVVKTNNFDGWVWSAPAIGSDGTVYASYGGYLYAYDSATGTEKWNVATGGSNSSPLFLEEGAVAFCSDSGIYFVKAATGSKWSPWPMAGHDPQRTFRALQRGLKVQKESDGIRLEMTMEKGKRYRLEASADLKDWMVMSDFVSTNAVAQFKDTSQRRRFYRSVAFP